MGKASLLRLVAGKTSHTPTNLFSSLAAAPPRSAPTQADEKRPQAQLAETPGRTV